MSYHDSETGYGGVLSALLPLFDDVFGRKSKLSFVLGDEVPSLFELETITSNSCCSFLKWNDFQGFSWKFHFSSRSNAAILVHLALRHLYIMYPVPYNMLLSFQFSFE